MIMIIFKKSITYMIFLSTGNTKKQK